MTDKDTLFESLVRWNFWGGRRSPLLKMRNILNELKLYIEDPYPVVLTGIRRSGKSSLFYLLIQTLQEKGLDPKQCLFINFEEPLFGSELSIEFFESLIDLYKEKVNPNKKIYYFLDEIQNLPDWQKWVRREADLKEHKIFLTGSSAKLLSSEISHLLTGRYYSFHVFPLSFREILQWHGVACQTDIDQIKNRAKIRQIFKAYLKWGGFPEVVLTDIEEKKNKILYQYFDDILFRDIVYRYQIRDVPLLQNVAHYYLTNMSSLYSLNRISNVLNTSMDNVRRYTTFLKESHLIFSIPRFSFKLGEQKRNPKKAYIGDNGFHHGVGFQFSPNEGRLAENILALHFQSQLKSLFYFKNDGECDFVVQNEKQFNAFQVTMENLTDETVKKREVKGLIGALEKLGKNKGIILTDDLEKEESFQDRKIGYIPLWKYLIQI